MNAMILAAGRGLRMGHLTNKLPKPLLTVSGKALIVWHLEKLARAGFTHVVVNHAYLGHKIEQALGDGRTWGVRIQYSAETQALETAGGIAKALPLLGIEPFAVISADAYSNFDYARLRTIAAQMEANELQGWCVLVNNPAHHLEGDFALINGTMSFKDSVAALANAEQINTFTYSGISMFYSEPFANIAPGQSEKLVTIMKNLCQKRQLGGEVHDGIWDDVGTPERLANLNRN
jgi:N-acetyl-alpha-D-muramate 1-phosphate uridylyltransferase